MDKRKIILALFVLVALVQLYVPAKMIMDKEDLLEDGITYYFKTAPVDPNDPFRGKYITLRFEDTRIEVKNEADWNYGETAYVLLENDDDGFAKIVEILKEAPENTIDYLEVKVRSVSTDRLNFVTIDYPFDRFYMEESKAYEAEKLYRESQSDTSKVAYAVVNVKEGDAVLIDVEIDGNSIADMVEIERQKNQNSD